MRLRYLKASSRLLTSTRKRSNRSRYLIPGQGHKQPRQRRHQRRQEDTSRILAGDQADAKFTVRTESVQVTEGLGRVEAVHLVSTEPLADGAERLRRQPFNGLRIVLTTNLAVTFEMTGTKADKVQRISLCLVK